MASVSYGLLYPSRQFPDGVWPGSGKSSHWRNEERNAMADDQNMHLVIIRHGESEWNKLNLFTGWTDVDLTDTGRAEAAAGGKALKE